MIHVRSAGVSTDIDYAAGMTVAEAMRKAGVRLPWYSFSKIFVGGKAVASNRVLLDGETVIIAPRIRNGV